MTDFQINSKVAKVDETLGLVFGWAIISKQDGEEYFDLQGDHIPEEAMLEAATDFMKNSREVHDMHKDENIGSVLFAFPMTEDIAKSLGIETTTTGLLIGMKPNDTVLEKFKSGEYTGFSIGGSRIKDEVVDA